MVRGLEGSETQAVFGDATADEFNKAEGLLEQSLGL